MKYGLNIEYIDLLWGFFFERYYQLWGTSNYVQPLPSPPANVTIAKEFYGVSHIDGSGCLKGSVFLVYFVVEPQFPYHPNEPAKSRLS